jgi:hypothetical protein
VLVAASFWGKIIQPQLPIPGKNARKVMNYSCPAMAEYPSKSYSSYDIIEFDLLINSLFGYSIMLPVSRDIPSSTWNSIYLRQDSNDHSESILSLPRNCRLLQYPKKGNIMTETNFN